MNYFKEFLKISPFSHALWRACEARSLKAIKLKRPILDLGCGFGEFAGVFHGSSIEMGIDNSNSDLEKAGQGGKYKKLILADARYMPFKDASFRTVFSISVIEHIPKTNEVLKEVHRVLKKDGMFVFTTPSKEFTKLLFYPKLLRVLHLENLALSYENKINKIFKHHSLFTNDEWVKMLTKRGFKVERIESNIGENVVMLWDLGLIFALPSQILKVIFGKRVVITSNVRINLLDKFFRKYTYKADGRPCNFLIVARKI